MKTLFKSLELIIGRTRAPPSLAVCSAPRTEEGAALLSWFSYFWGGLFEFCELEFCDERAQKPRDDMPDVLLTDAHAFMNIKMYI